MTQRRQLRSSLNANTGIRPDVRVCEAVYFWHDNSGWVGPGIVIRIDQHNLHIAHGGIVKTADRFWTRPALNALQVAHDEFSDPNRETIDKASDNTQQEASIGEGQAHRRRKLTRVLKQLNERTKIIIQNLQRRRAPN